MIVWSIWNQRNRVRLQQPSWALHLISRASKDQLAEFLVLQSPPKPTQIHYRVHWKTTTSWFCQNQLRWVCVSRGK